MSLPEQILDCLAQAGFETGTTPLLPLGQPLPLVTGWAVSRETGTLALVAEAEPEWNNDAWRELLFALASLRHELRRGRRSAFGTPITLAVLRDENEAQRLRELAEELSRDYLLFTRLELNVIVDGPDVDVEVELAPLLPRCRRAIREGAVVGAEALTRLANQLREEIRMAAEQLDEEDLRPLAEPVAEAIAEEIASLVEVDLSNWPRPEPIARIVLDNFRVFEHAELDLQPFTLLEGLNGTGKSSVIEALEVAWTGTSSRRPLEVSATEFDRHLKRRGELDWNLRFWRHGTDGAEDVRSTSEQRPRLGLGRTLYAADVARDIAREAPEDRYSEFLRVVGLEAPELNKAAEDLRQSAKRQLNGVLEKLGLPPVARVDTPAAAHVRQHLGRIPAIDTSPWSAIQKAAQAVAETTRAEGLAFRLPLEIGRVDDERFEQLTARARELAPTLSTSPDYLDLAHQIANDFEVWATQTEQYAVDLNRLLSRVAESGTVQVLEAQTGLAGSVASPAVPPAVATAWLYAARTLRQTVGELAALEDSISDLLWRQRLAEFLERTRRALEVSHIDELEETLRHRPLVPSRPTRPTRIAPDLLIAAGMSEASIESLPPPVVQALTELRNASRGLAAAQREVARSMGDSPLSRLEGFQAELQSAIARSELVRRLQEPLERAQQKVLDSLFGETLRDILVELIMALTRFEWYFAPPEISVSGKSVRIGGMATPMADLDIRMLLNAGERSIVTFAWFLALHLLQPDVDRKTLVLDDPFAHLDNTNEASAIATLRTMLRLTKPDLFIFSSHDQALADTLDEEFAQFNEWPQRQSRYRFARKADGTASVTADVDAETAADITGELERAGLLSLTGAD